MLQCCQVSHCFFCVKDGKESSSDTVIAANGFKHKHKPLWHINYDRSLENLMCTGSSLSFLLKTCSTSLEDVTRFVIGQNVFLLCLRLKRLQYRQCHLWFIDEKHNAIAFKYVSGASFCLGWKTHSKILLEDSLAFPIGNANTVLWILLSLVLLCFFLNSSKHTIETYIRMGRTMAVHIRTFLALSFIYLKSLFNL